MGIALPFEQRFSMGFPAGSGVLRPMVGLQADNQGAVIIGTNSVQSMDTTIPVRSPTTWEPNRQKAPDVELGVSEQAVPPVSPACLRSRPLAKETIPDGVDGQRTGFDNPEGCDWPGKRTRLACMSCPNISLMWLRIRSWLNMAIICRVLAGQGMAIIPKLRHASLIRGMVKHAAPALFSRGCCLSFFTA